jgi:hypothetical protein
VAVVPAAFLQVAAQYTLEALMDRKPYYIDLYRRVLEEARIGYTLAIFGDHLAAQQEYENHTGLDAVHFFLMQKHHWTRGQIQAMTHADILFAMSEEFELWTMPDDARQVLADMIEHHESSSST